MRRYTGKEYRSQNEKNTGMIRMSTSELLCVIGNCIVMILIVIVILLFVFSEDGDNTTVYINYNQTVITDCCDHCTENQSYSNQTVVISENNAGEPVIVTYDDTTPDSPVVVTTPMLTPEFPFLGGHAKISVSFANMFALARTSVGIP